MLFLDKWNKYWFSSAPYVDLAIVRILIVGLQLYLVVNAFDRYVVAAGLPAETFNPLPALKVLMLPLGWGARPDLYMVIAVFWGTVTVGILAFVGMLTNLNLFLFALGSMFLQAFIYSFGEQHHPEAIMMIALLVFSFGPCGKVFSVDSYVKRLISKGKVNGEVRLLEYTSPYAGWPIKLMMFVFSLIYLSAITSKLMHGGVDWVNGITLQFYLVQDGMRWGNDLAVRLAQHHEFIYFVQVVVVFFQSTFFLIIFFPKLRWVYLPVGLLFHFGIYLTLRAPFPQWIILYSLFVPWSRVFEWLASSSIAIVDESTKRGV